VHFGKQCTEKKLMISDPYKKYFLNANKMGFLITCPTWNSTN